MAQSASSTLKASAASSDRAVTLSFRVAWGRTADDWPSNWATQATDESARVLSLSVDRRLDMQSALGSSTPAARMSIVLDNRDQRYSPFNSSSPLAASILGTATTAGGVSVEYPRLRMTPVRLRMGFTDVGNGNEYVTLFTGVIDDADDSYGLSHAQVQLTCLDRSAVLLDRKASTEVVNDVPIDDWLRRLVSDIGGIATGQTLDRATFSVPHAWLDDEGIWSEIQQAAAADGGYAFFDESGVFLYKNAAWWAMAPDSTTPVVTIDTRYQQLNPAAPWRDVASGVIVEYQPRGAGGEQIIWRNDGTLVVPPGVKEIDAKFSNPVTLLLPPVSPRDWQAVTSGGMDITPEVGIELFEQRAQRCKIKITNNAPQTVFLHRMQMRGLTLVGGPQEQIDISADTPLVPENRLRIGRNPYIQSSAQADLIATLAAWRKIYPRLVYSLTGVPALPWLQLGDCITLAPETRPDTGTSVLASSRKAIITGMAFSWQPVGGFLMNIEAVDAAGLFEFGGYHVLGTHKYGNGRVFV